MEYHGNGIYMPKPEPSLRLSIQASFQIGLDKKGVPFLVYTVIEREYNSIDDEPDGPGASLKWTVPFSMLREHAQFVHEFQPEIIELLSGVADKFNSGGYKEQIDSMLSDMKVEDDGAKE